MSKGQRDADNDPPDLGKQQHCPVLRMPLHLGVILLGEERNEAQEAEIRQDEKDRLVGSWGRPRCSGPRRRRVRPATRRSRRWHGGRWYLAHYFSLLFFTIRTRADSSS